jgi:predicted PurR-regulated permease PerM
MRTPDNSGSRQAVARNDARTSAPTTLRTLLTDHLGWLGLRSAQVLLALALVAVVIFVLVQVKLVVIPVLIAIILASALSPVVGWLRRRGLSAILATWVTLLAAIVVFGGIVTLIVFAVENQWSSLYSSASDGIDELSTYLADGPLAIDATQIEDAKNAGIDFLTSSQFGSGAIAGVSAAGQFITGLVLVIVILFFFLKDGDVIWDFFLKPFRGERLARGRRIGITSVRVLGGYIRGTAIVAFVDAAAIGIGLAILGVPLALPLAVIVFLTAFIPLIGATVAGILAALVALVATDLVTALIVVGIVVLVNQLEGNFLQPVVMAQSLKLHPLVILVALTAGTIVAGIIGAVLAVPIAAVGWAIAKTWNEPGLKPGPTLA